jgi:hypothetical protein
MGHLPESKLLLECRMDKYEIRRRNLQALLRSHCDGRAATLADLIERSPSYVSRMLYPEGKDGKKRIGEDMRDIIEDALSLKRGSLDKEPTGDVVLADETSAAEAPAIGAPTKSQARTKVSPETSLDRLDASEKEILDLYRRATEKGKTMIRNAAVAVPKADD